MTIERLAVSLVFGAVCGSFAGLVADRVPRGESVLTGRSTCRGCDLPLGARDLVPVLSWLCLRGRCRRCHDRIGSTALVVEILTALLFAAVAHRFEDPLVLLAHWVLVIGLVSLSVIDVFTMRLPRRIIHATALVGIPILSIASVSLGIPERLITGAIGAVSAWVAMALLYVMSRGRFGDGDVRLSPLLGLYLGWSGGALVFSGFLLSFVLGALCGLMWMAWTRLRRSTAIPFGPFLAAGTVLTLVWQVNVVVTH